MIKTFFVKTYGCAMNIADSNTITNLLTNYNLKESKSWKDADLIILVTCSVRQQAEDKVAGWGIKAAGDLFKGKKVILTGCMAQRYDREDNSTNEKYEKKLKETYPWIDYVVNIKDVEEIPQLLKLDNMELLKGKDINYDCNNKYQGLFSISHGCNNFCSYCIVPYARGELINFPKEEILNEVKSFVNNGGKLVTLLGQNVNSWKYTDENFVDLLKEISNIEGDFWINFLSSHPKDFSDELIELITSNEKFLKHCNIALQSASNRILKLMNRQYSVKRFEDICKKIYAKDSNFRITTDIIIGFPTESDNDFVKSLNVIKNCNIQMAYIGKYSPRKGTKAYQLDDNIPLETKKERERELKKMVNDIREREHNSLIGESIPVLMITKDKGISYYNHDIITKENYTPGEFVQLEITDYSKAGLYS